MRLTTSTLDISRLKMATPLLWSTATLRAMLSAKAVLPMEGRAARMTRLDGLEAADHGVEIAEAGLAPDGAVPLGHEPLELGEALGDELADGLELPGHPALGDVEHHLLGPVDELDGRAAPAGSPSR